RRGGPGGAHAGRGAARGTDVPGAGGRGQRGGGERQRDGDRGPLPRGADGPGDSGRRGRGRRPRERRPRPGDGAGVSAREAPAMSEEDLRAAVASLRRQVRALAALLALALGLAGVALWDGRARPAPAPVTDEYGAIRGQSLYLGEEDMDRPYVRLKY